MNYAWLNRDYSDPETDELMDTESPRAPDALPSLPAHLQHMADRPWVVALQLRWVKNNLLEDRAEKEQ